MLYNKGLCEALLMAESDLEDDALKKLGSCVDVYFEKYTVVPTEPVLYKLALLIRIAIMKGEEREMVENDSV